MSAFKEYVPNERIVDRACALWVAMLSNPKYDNLGKDSPESPQSIMANTMSSMLASMLKKNNTPEVLTKFSAELKTILMNGHSGKWTHGDKADFKFGAVNHLSVDYGADIHLKAAAEKAGLEMEFPWKTTMGLNADCLYLGYGYGSPYVYHYPLAGDRWLETTLSGGDLSKIIALVESGVLGLSLEAAK